MRYERREWLRSIALLLALPAFFVLMGIGLHACSVHPCGCPAEHAVTSHP
jgi:hypothetical protein